ncbi:MAG: CtsR family transcriptional regulator [Clostridium sp.]|jgi:transcriptional regulator CtsR|nr:CtsR family transcriptional regulator [Clostridium sp.]
MSLSNQIANMIFELLERDDSAEIQRNELAQSIGCVPSQINYVLSSRFTPERGYLVESRRGGGGYIKITRVPLSRGLLLLHALNAVGDSLGEAVCAAHVRNLFQRGVVSAAEARLIISACSERALAPLPPSLRDTLRASIFKQMAAALPSIDQD